MAFNAFRCELVQPRVVHGETHVASIVVLDIRARRAHEQPVTIRMTKHRPGSTTDHSGVGAGGPAELRVWEPEESTLADSQASSCPPGTAQATGEGTTEAVAAQWAVAVSVHALKVDLEREECRTIMHAFQDLSRASAAAAAAREAQAPPPIPQQGPTQAEPSPTITVSVLEAVLVLRGNTTPGSSSTSSSCESAASQGHEETKGAPPAPPSEPSGVRTLKWVLGGFEVQCGAGGGELEIKSHDVSLWEQQPTATPPEPTSSSRSSSRSGSRGSTSERASPVQHQ